MQDLQSQQQSQQTQMAMGGNMYYNGGPPYDLPGMADMDASEYSNINNYLTNLDTPNVVDNQGNTTSILDRQKNINLNTPNPINNFLNTVRSYLNKNKTNVEMDPIVNAYNRSTTDIVDPKDYPTIFTQGNSGLESKVMKQEESMSPYQRWSLHNNPKALNSGNLIYDDSGEYTGFINPKAKTSKLNNNLNEKEPWYEEPLYSKLARYAPLGASAAGAITALKNKKRSLTPEDTLSSKINLERSRITTAEEGRRGLDTALRTVRGGAGSSGQLNAATRDLVLTGNKNIAANINKLYETEENTNAQLAQQAALANQKYGNEFKITNEEMFQNAQSQAIKAAQEGAMALQSGAEQERKQYLQEWIAKNRLKTRNMITGPDGKDYYYNPATGKFNSIDTGEQFDSLT
jgi:hypothetical protein